VVLVDKQLTTIQECTIMARKANSILGCIKRIFANRGMEVNLSLLITAEAISRVLASVWDFPVQDRQAFTGLSLAQGHKSD